MSSLSDEEREWVIALYVDKGLNLLSVETVAIGDAGGAALPIGKVICQGLARGAKGFFLAHNHPSGVAKPSAADMEVTRRMVRISYDLDLPLLEHVIVTGNELTFIPK